VYFEIGLALGVGRPVFIFGDVELELPVELKGLTRHPLEVRFVIDIVRRQLEKTPQELRLGQTAAPTKARRRPVPEWSVALQQLNQLRKASSMATGDVQTIRQLYNVFTSLGFTVVEARDSERSRAPDLAVWMDELEKDVGNPLAIEVKSAAVEQLDLQIVASQLAQYVASGGAAAGLIIYPGSPINTPGNILRNTPPIVALSLNELATLIAGRRLIRFLKASVATAKRVA
jgi:hypothetical protein